MWRIATHVSVTLLRTVVSVLFVFAMAGLLLSVAFGFEEPPNNALLLFSSGLLLIAVLAVFAHLAVTSELNRSEKRLWLARLTGRRAPWALCDYLSCDDLRANAVSVPEDDH